MSWGSEPLLAELFPGLWEYYVNTAKGTDQFFSATGGAGYAYPWALPTPEKYFIKAAQLNDDYMPADQWIDIWEGGCPHAADSPSGGMNPCLPMYEAFRNASLHTAGGRGAVGGFSQQPTLANNSAFPHYVYNGWLGDGTPVLLQPQALWYPQDKKFCNRTDADHGAAPSAEALAEEYDCIEGHLRKVAAANSQRPLFVPVYGVDNYVDVAREMAKRLGDEFAVVGTQDFAVLGRDAAPTVHQ